MTVYDFTVSTSFGGEQALRDFDGNVLLIVNTASKCGFTPQYEGLERLYQKYKDSGFYVLAFPCNQFAGQEPGSNEDIQNFCKNHYSVSFPVFAKIEVRGANAHPLYQHLTQTSPGWLHTKTVKWNFTKFLVNRSGQVVKRFAPNVKPQAIEPDIQALLDETSLQHHVQ